MGRRGAGLNTTRRGIKKRLRALQHEAGKTYL